MATTTQSFGVAVWKDGSIPSRSLQRIRADVSNHRARTFGSTSESPKPNRIDSCATHVLLDVWHANRHPDYWGEPLTGYSATVFEPQRWQAIADKKENSKDFLHFGFGHGSRVCPGKHLGQMELELRVPSVGMPSSPPPPTACPVSTTFGGKTAGRN